MRGKTVAGAIVVGLSYALEILFPQFGVLWGLLRAAGASLFGVGVAHKFEKLITATKSSKSAGDYTGPIAGALVLLLIAAPASALNHAPFAAIQVDRLSGPDQWSTGVNIGYEVSSDPITVFGAYKFHDILSESDAYPWDGTFEMGAGVYHAALDVFGVTATPYAQLVLSRPTEPAEWSTGARLGLEFDFDSVWLAPTVDIHDLVTDDEVYPWDTTFGLALGVHFGQDD